MEIEGKIFQILPLKEGDSKTTGTHWKMQPFVLETEERYQNKIYFEIFGEQRINEISIHEGDTVKVSFDLNSRQYNDSWFTSARVWKIEKIERGGSMASQSQQVEKEKSADTIPPQETFNENDEGNDLPF